MTKLGLLSTFSLLVSGDFNVTERYLVEEVKKINFQSPSKRRFQCNGSRQSRKQQNNLNLSVS